MCACDIDMCVDILALLLLLDVSGYASASRSLGRPASSFFFAFGRTRDHDFDEKFEMVVVSRFFFDLAEA